MEAIVATAGGILLVLSFGGAGPITSNLAGVGQPVPQGDRIFAGLLGFVLVALAAVLEDGSSNDALWAILLAGGAVVVGYAVFIAVTAREGAQRRQSSDREPDSTGR